MLGGAGLTSLFLSVSCVATKAILVQESPRIKVIGHFRLLFLNPRTIFLFSETPKLCIFKNYLIKI